MNNTSIKIIVLNSLLSICICQAAPELYTIDKTLAVVYHPEETTVLVQSDLRPGLDGVAKTLEQAVLERLMLLDAKKLKITIPDKDIDNRLARIQEENKLTLDDIKNLFKQSGYSYDEGREQLRTMETIDMLMSYRIKNKALVDKKDIEAYYKENPAYQDAAYIVSQAVVPFADSSPELVKLRVKRDIETGALKKDIEANVNRKDLQWSAPVELKDEDFAQDKAYIKELEPGALVILQENPTNLIVLRLISKKPKQLVPLESRMKEITNTLGKERFDKAFKEYQDTLFATAQVKYLDKK